MIGIYTHCAALFAYYMINRVARLPVLFHSPGQYFTANLAETSKRPVYFKNLCLKLVFRKKIICRNLKELIKFLKLYRC